MDGSRVLLLVRNNFVPIIESIRVLGLEHVDAERVRGWLSSNGLLCAREASIFGLASALPALSLGLVVGAELPLPM